MNGNGNDAIFAPVFKGTVYKGHQCSECKYRMTLEQNIWGGVDFGPTNKLLFCPHCGRPIARFSEKPIYEKQIDFEPLRPFYELHNEFEDKAIWLFQCKMNDEQRDKVRELLPFEDAEPKYGWTRIAIKVAREAANSHPSWQTLKKLRKRFDGKHEEAEA